MRKTYIGEKLIARQLRLEGKSYREIQQATGVRSRSTLSEWFKNLDLPPAVKILLDQKRIKAQEGVLKGVLSVA